MLVDVFKFQIVRIQFAPHDPSVAQRASFVYVLAHIGAQIVAHHLEGEKEGISILPEVFATNVALSESFINLFLIVRYRDTFVVLVEDYEMFVSEEKVEFLLVLRLNFEAIADYLTIVKVTCLRVLAYHAPQAVFTISTEENGLAWSFTASISE